MWQRREDVRITNCGEEGEQTYHRALITGDPSRGGGRYISTIPAVSPSGKRYQNWIFEYGRRARERLRIPRLVPSIFMSATYGPLGPHCRYTIEICSRDVSGNSKAALISLRLPSLSLYRSRDFYREIAEKSRGTIGGQIDCSFIRRRFKDDLVDLAPEGPRFVTCDRILSYPRELWFRSPHGLIPFRSLMRRRIQCEI